MKKRTPFMLAAMAAGVVFAASPAIGETASSESVVMEFAYSPSDFSSYEGTEAVYQKLRSAAHRSCTQSGSAIPQLVQQKMHAGCINDLISRTIEQINSPDLLAMHDKQMRLAARDL